MQNKEMEYVTITVPRVMVERIIEEKEMIFKKVTKDIKSTIVMLEKAHSNGKVDTGFLVQMAVAEKLIGEVFKDALNEALAKTKNECTYRN